MFITAGSIETVVFDMQTALIEIHDTTFFCKTKKKAFDMKEVRDVRCFKRGHEGIQIVTLRFEINVEFNNAKPLKVLETKQRSKAIRYMVMIRNFLGYTCTESDVRIFDESSRI